MKALILRLDAPILSFGTVMVDQHGYTDFFPGMSMLTGLIANSLGWHHGDFGKLQQLQQRIDFAARWDVKPTPIIDYHTVDLGSDKMCNPGWTTRGYDEHRTGGQARLGTHQRNRHYLEDGLMTVALGVLPGHSPTIHDIKSALIKPARPLFLGRKTCLPSRPILDAHDPIVEGESLVDILERVPIWDRFGQVVSEPKKTWACWSPTEAGGPSDEANLVYDLRDWQSQLPAGSRIRIEGMIGGEK